MIKKSLLIYFLNADVIFEVAKEHVADLQIVLNNIVNQIQE